MMINSTTSTPLLSVATARKRNTTTFHQTSFGVGRRRGGFLSDDNSSFCTKKGGAGMFATTTSSLMPKALAAKKTHKEAERRRRSRINTHLATLRTLFPNLIKTDKASVLSEVVRRIQELKQTTSTTIPTSKTTPFNTNNDISTTKKTDENILLIPNDTDEVHILSHHYPPVPQLDNNNNNDTVSAAFCCEDRHDLIPDVTRALQNVKGGKLIRAEMATVGGRIKFVLCVKREVGGCGVEEIGKELRKALKIVVEKRCGGGLGSTKSKR